MIVAMANMPFYDSWQMFEEEASGMILVFRLLGIMFGITVFFVIWSKAILLYTAILIEVVSLRCGAAEVIQAEVVATEVPAAPRSQKVEGKLPKSLLLVKLEERGENVFDDPSCTSYHVYDPALPENGLVRIFRGPENDQDLRPLTPLYDGWALSQIHLDRKKDPEGKSKWAWYYYPEGIIGEEVKDQFVIIESKDEWLFGEKVLRQGIERRRHLMRYRPRVGKMEQTKLLFSHTQWISSTEVLGVADIEKENRIILFDVHRFEYRDLGPPPPNFESTRSGIRGIPTLRLQFAGEGGVDGIYLSSREEGGFTLHFLPSGGKWVEVISGVEICKTFGGRPPSLPVDYLGGGQFAVSKTTVDTVPAPDDWPEDEKIFGAAKGVTMLIEGASGKVLKVSEAFIYSHNPPLKIPKSWWRDGFKPKVPFLIQEEGEKPSLFQWNEELRTLGFANGSEVSLGEEECYRACDRGLHAVVFREWTKKEKNKKAMQELRVIDGKGGGIQQINIESDFHEVMTQAFWIETALP